MDDLLNEHDAQWRETIEKSASRPAWAGALVDELGQSIMTHINASADVNPVNLLALVLLGTPRHALGEKLLRRQLDLYKNLLSQKPTPERTTLTDKTAEEIILAGTLASEKGSEDAIDKAVSGCLKDPKALDAYTVNKFIPFDPVGKRTEGDVTDAHQTQGLAGYAGAHHVGWAPSSPFPVTQMTFTFTHAPGNREQQGQCEISGTVGEHFRGVGDCQTGSPGCFEVYMIEANAITTQNSGSNIIRA